jgi:hypothetical protein
MPRFELGTDGCKPTVLPSCYYTPTKLVGCLALNLQCLHMPTRGAPRRISTYCITEAGAEKGIRTNIGRRCYEYPLGESYNPIKCLKCLTSVITYYHNFYILSSNIYLSVSICSRITSSNVRGPALAATGFVALRDGNDVEVGAFCISLITPCFILLRSARSFGNTTF